MKHSFEAMKQALTERNISLSHQRLKILEYLSDNPCHPTVDKIFTCLQKDIPTLSKTTVYNTLKLLTEAGLVRMITIEENETRYDIEIQDHGHFKCEQCGKIYNFNADIDRLPIGGLENFQINDKNIYFKGICPSCLSKYKQK